MAFSFPPFAALLDKTDSSSASLLASVARIAPVIVRSGASVQLPSGAEQWTLLDASATEADAIAAFDRGARYVLAPSAAVARLEGLPSDRVIPIFDQLDGQIESASAVCLSETAGLDAGIVAEARKRLGKADEKTLLVFRSQVAERFPEFASLGAHGTTPIVPLSELAQLEAAEGFLGGYFFSRLRSDRADGLIPTVVRTVGGASLGLVYSSLASLTKSIVDPEARATCVECARSLY